MLFPRLCRQLAVGCTLLITGDRFTRENDVASLSMDKGCGRMVIPAASLGTPRPIVTSLSKDYTSHLFAAGRWHRFCMN